MTTPTDYRAVDNDVRKALAGYLGLPVDEVKDALQFAWVRYVERADHIDHDRLAGWLFVVARNEYYRQYRHQLREPATDILPEPATEDDLAAVMNLRDALLRLRPYRRTAVVARLLGLTYRQTAVATQRTPTWVNRHITEGRAELREELAA